MDYRKPDPGFLHSIDVHGLLPQQEPFIMIGGLEKFEMKKIVTSTRIPAGNIFVEDGCFSASGLIENIAQTCAARIGYVNRYILKKEIQIGVIGSIRNLKIEGLPRVGDRIVTTVDVIEEVFGMTLVSAVISCNGERLVTAQMKIAVNNEETVQ